MFGIPRCRPEADRSSAKTEDKSGVTETGNRAGKVSGTPRVGASLPLK